MDEFSQKEIDSGFPNFQKYFSSLENDKVIHRFVFNYGCDDILYVNFHKGYCETRDFNYVESIDDYEEYTMILFHDIGTDQVFDISYLNLPKEVYDNGKLVLKEVNGKLEFA